MKTIFLVVKYETDYDSSTFEPLYSTFDHTKAENKVKEMELLKSAVLDAKKAIAEHLEQWSKNNPRVLAQPAKLKPVPKFSGPKKKWTDEQLAEYNRITQFNWKAAMEAAAPSHKWVDDRYNEQLRFTRTYPEDVQANLHYITDITEYDIEEVPFEE